MLTSERATQAALSQAPIYRRKNALICVKLFQPSAQSRRTGLLLCLVCSKLMTSLYHAHVPPVFRLCPACVSPVSRLCLACVPPVSRLQLAGSHRESRLYPVCVPHAPACVPSMPCLYSSTARLCPARVPPVSGLNPPVGIQPASFGEVLHFA